MRSEEGKTKQREAIRRWQKANPEKVKAAKQRYYSSEKGKLQKRKEDASYALSGGRAEAEARRANTPLSEARLAAKVKWRKANSEFYAADRAMRRSLERDLSDFDRFVLHEAMVLAKLRNHLVGGKWEVDHIIPVSKGGNCIASNLQVVPKHWNQSKSNKHSERLFGSNANKGAQNAF